MGLMVHDFGECSSGIYAVYTSNPSKARVHEQKHGSCILAPGNHEPSVQYLKGHALAGRFNVGT